LGLSIVYGIIGQHDGLICVKSEPGEGTVFKIYLPLRDQPKKEASVLSPSELEGGTETILIVEDDPAVLAIHKSLLERAGYMVLSASDGREALELYRHGSDQIALVVLDVIMSGMNGKEVYEQLKQYNNAVKVLFASGYTPDILHRHGVIHESIHFISKPLNPGLFLERVRILIDGYSRQMEV
jgi:CheY-like chemotaxis protein